ncbi:hypothetical protein JN531_017045 (plasmid) [Flagellatimonas centrodinii]|uniref:hypothetical protein n=1 Tax=Flagellatimonas centrodinii TaxID=2806210 RepID=UPI001FEDC2EA|nr:hypothetical protein [Flagellatimonas centrodinii]ULQ48340.1 hypothetical protein JN531_017045 [Flagellatimonas centrodinii]
MKRLAIAAAIAVTTSTGHAQGLGPDSASADVGLLFDVALPDDQGRTFKYIDGTVQSNVRVGCDGMTTGNLGAQVIGDVQSFITYFQSNVAGMAINFLIYSSPTLYQLLENLNIHKDFLRELNAFNCASVRDMAKDRRNSEISEAKNKCIESGEAPGACDDGDLIKEYMPDAMRDLNDRLKEITSAAGDFDLQQTIKEYLGQLGTLPPGGTRTEVRDDGVARELAEVRESISFNMVTVPEGSGDGLTRFNFEPPRKSVQQVFDERVPKYRELLDAVTSAGMSGQDLDEVAEFQRLKADPAFPVLDRSTLATMFDMRRNIPLRYKEVEKAAARRMTLAYIRFAIAEQEAIYANLLAGGTGAKLDRVAEDVIVWVERDIKRLKAQLQLEEVRVQNTDYLKGLEQKLIGM